MKSSHGLSMVTLRLGYNKLNKHMDRIRLSKCTNHTHCNIPESVEHFLLHCKFNI